MSLPPSFSGNPIEELSHYYRNICIEVKKALKSTRDIEILKGELERFIHANKKVKWPHPTTQVFHRDEAEKAVGKVVSAFERYLQELNKAPDKATPQDVLEALSIIESMIDQLKVR